MASGFHSNAPWQSECKSPEPTMAVAGLSKAVISRLSCYCPGQNEHTLLSAGVMHGLRGDNGLEKESFR